MQKLPRDRVELHPPCRHARSANSAPLTRCGKVGHAFSEDPPISGKRFRCARFSTDKQRDASIEDQYRVCERTAQTAGLQVVARFEDKGISAGTAERPGYQALLTAARAHDFDVIIAEDVSRLWRNRAEFGPRSAELEDLGVHL